MENINMEVLIKRFQGEVLKEVESEVEKKVITEAFILTISKT